MDASIGAFEAKAQLSRLLRAVENGERSTITVRGKPVADLVPHRNDPGQGVDAAVAALRAEAARASPHIDGGGARHTIRNLRTFMNAAPRTHPLLSHADVPSLMDGARFLHSHRIRLLLQMLQPPAPLGVGFQVLSPLYSR